MSDAKASEQRLRPLKRTLSRLWLFSPERLWLLSISLQRDGHWRLAFAVKQLNTILYHNSLSPEAVVSPDVELGHYSHGIVVNGGVEIGRRVKIWHNVTLTGRAARSRGPRARGRAQILVEDGVRIGTNAVVIGTRGELLRIGHDARIGAGAIVTHDIPPRATVVSPPARVVLAEERAGAHAPGEAKDAEVGWAPAGERAPRPAPRADRGDGDDGDGAAGPGHVPPHEGSS
ncbi:MAG: Serine acetyltransferase [Solirubrobacterales bacterium]|nr:Serine acetyltransferase [Solirubrobacterales bacterium]